MHRPAEKAIEASGLAWTFLRPNGFMQNFVTFMGPSIKAEGTFYSSTGRAKMSHVDVRDIAAVAVKALTAPGHEGKIYTLTGPEALTYDEMADELSQVLGREIRHIDLPPADLKAAMVAGGMSEEIADLLLDLERYYREGRPSRVTDDVKRVTGRDPRPFTAYVRETAETGAWNAEAA
ncbi:MAG: NmrA family NAD(P)-binding protein [Methyloceanibacter sp.]|uniref:NmrA family NAD(P)-binding protein n=1 Tax=Methyloceanibacter sp. TaxID=1965321 RepID=UPI003D6CBDF2